MDLNFDLEGWRTLFAFGYAILSAALMIGGISCVWSYAAQIVDWKWNPQRLADKNAERREKNPDAPLIKVNWRRARIQQIVVMRLGYPLGLIVLGAMAYHWFVSFNATTYGIIAIGWFIGTVPRNIWAWAAMHAVNNKLHQDNPELNHRFTYTCGENLRHHYKWAFSKQEQYTTRKRKTEFFYTRLTWLNPAIRLILDIVQFRWLGQLYQLRTVAPLLVYGIGSLFWPIAGTISVFYHCFSAAEQDKELKPWWVGRKHEPKRAKTKRPAPSNKSLVKS